MSLSLLLGATACGQPPPHADFDAGVQDATVADAPVADGPTGDATPPDDAPHSPDAASAVTPECVSFTPNTPPTCGLDHLWIGYRADQDTDQVEELYVVEVTNMSLSAPQKVNEVFEDSYRVRKGSGPGFRWSPDGTALVYNLRRAATDQIYWVDLSTSTPGSPERVNNVLVPGGGVKELGDFSPDSSRYAYVADEVVEGVRELWMSDVSGDAPAPAVRMNAAMTSLDMGVYSGSEPGFSWSSDSNMLLYRSNHDDEDSEELFAVPATDPGNPIKVNGPLATGKRVDAVYGWSPDGAKILFSAPTSVFGPDQLQVATVSDLAVAAPQAISSTGATFTGRQVSADSSKVLYSSSNRLYGADISGANPKLPYELTPAAPIFWLTFALSRDSQTVAIRGLEVEDSADFSMWVTKICGPQAGQLYELSAPGVVRPDFSWSPDGSKLLFRSGSDLEEEYDLYLADVSSYPPGPPTKVNGDLIAGGTVETYSWSPDSRWVAYQADQNEDDIVELFVFDTDNPSDPAVRVHTPLTPLYPSVVGDVLSHFWGPSSERLLYVADGDVDDTVEAYLVDVSDSLPATPLKIHGDFTAEMDVFEVQWSCTHE